jgi:hypothetical protein
MKTIEERLRKTLTPDLVPEDDLNAGILKQAKEIETMKSKKLRPSVAAAVVVGVLAIGSVSTYAAYHFLTPAQVADTISDGKKLSAAFAGDDATLVNETQQTGDYNVTFLGTVTGKALVPVVEDTEDAAALSENRTYAVVAIEKADGSPMPEITEADYRTFCVSALVHGKQFSEANNGLLNAGATSFVQDGVQYQLFACDDLEIFSGMGVSLGVVESFGQETSAFLYDANTGLYSKNPNYDKMNALFDLPLDISKADNEAANNYLREQAEENDAVEDAEISTGNEDVDAWITAFSDAKDSSYEAWKNAMENAREDTESRQVCKMDEDGYVSFTARDGENMNYYEVKDWSYAVGVEMWMDASTDGTLEGTAARTITQNEDGTFTVKYYIPSVE